MHNKRPHKSRLARRDRQAQTRSRSSSLLMRRRSWMTSRTNSSSNCQRRAGARSAATTDVRRCVRAKRGRTRAFPPPPRAPTNKASAHSALGLPRHTFTDWESARSSAVRRSRFSLQLRHRTQEELSRFFARRDSCPSPRLLSGSVFQSQRARTKEGP